MLPNCKVNDKRYSNIIIYFIVRKLVKFNMGLNILYTRTWKIVKLFITDASNTNSSIHRPRLTSSLTRIHVIAPDRHHGASEKFHGAAKLLRPFIFCEIHSGPDCLRFLSAWKCHYCLCSPPRTFCCVGIWASLWVFQGRRIIVINVLELSLSIMRKGPSWLLK